MHAIPRNGDTVTVRSNNGDIVLRVIGNPEFLVFLADYTGTKEKAVARVEVHHEP